jgi:hypothetical protein
MHGRKHYQPTAKDTWKAKAGVCGAREFFKFQESKKLWYIEQYIEARQTR